MQSTKNNKLSKPIKDVEDVKKVSNYFIAKKAYRNNLLFVVDVNTGLRCGDLLKLRVRDLIDEKQTFKQSFEITEEKTGKNRTCYINNAVMDAAELYFNYRPKLFMDDLLFTKDDGNVMEYHQVDRIIKNTIKEVLGLDIRSGIHTLRKTFAYHMIMNASDRIRAIELLQKILGHSSASITLAYAGITDDEIHLRALSDFSGGSNDFNRTRTIDS